VEPSGRDCFALLDDREATHARPTSRLYQGLQREHRCVDPAELDAVWVRVHADLRAGLHAVLLADYEWGAKLLKAGDERLDSDDPSSLRVLMFRELALLSEPEVSDWLARLEADETREAGDAQSPAAVAGVMDLKPSVDRPGFTQAIARIHEAIAAGETYQVNYTYRLQGQADGSPTALYRQLRARQPVAYGALIVLPDVAQPAGGGARHDACAVVFAGALPALRDWPAHGASNEGHGRTHAGARKRQRDRAPPVDRHQEPRRERDDRRPAAQ